MTEAAGRLALGTVQLGQAYGVSRAADTLPDGAAILAAADAAGITLLDTAAHYGIAEQVIGDYLAAHPASPFRVASKLHPQGDCATVDAVVAQVAASGQRLGRPPAAMLLHNMSLLDSWDGPVGRGLRAARDRGLTAAIGVSVYTPDEFRRALAHPDMAMIQAPLSVIDRRLADQGLLAEAAGRGIEVVLRSTFLQGLLLMAPERLPPHMAFARPAMAAFHAVCQRFAVPPAQACLQAALALAPAARLVIGCHDVAQLADNVAALAHPLPAGALDALLALPQGAEELINPARWPRPECPT